MTEALGRNFFPWHLHLQNKSSRSQFNSGPILDKRAGMVPIFHSCRACASSFIGCIEVTSSESSVGTEAALQSVAWTVLPGVK